MRRWSSVYDIAAKWSKKVRITRVKNDETHVTVDEACKESHTLSINAINKRYRKDKRVCYFFIL